MSDCDLDLGKCPIATTSGRARRRRVLRSRSGEARVASPPVVLLPRLPLLHAQGPHRRERTGHRLRERPLIHGAGRGDRVQPLFGDRVRVHELVDAFGSMPVAQPRGSDPAGRGASIPAKASVRSAENPPGPVTYTSAEAGIELASPVGLSAAAAIGKVPAMIERICSTSSAVVSVEMPGGSARALHRPRRG